ncbi:hypothetical protein ACN28C_28785 [Plantactinospora sp. WMMC1484]|uniref:hypothetical protein n=1 Tax=Plantactinospora sp. WMMC1484 TaxID=3404122 RepID=UPI003BF520AF
MATRRAGGRRPRCPGWPIVAAFAVTQTVGYGTLYYSFAVLLPPMTADLHASATRVTGAFTAAILAIGGTCGIAAVGILAKAASASPMTGG